jgi:hypothetical protein
MQATDNEKKAPVYSIPRHVHFCETGGQVIFLDLRRDKYLAIGPREKAALAGRVAGWQAPAGVPSAPSDDRILESLRQKGLLSSNGAANRDLVRPIVDAPRDELVSDDFELPTVTHGYFGSFLSAVARAVILRRLRSLEEVVEYVRRRKLLEERKDAPVDQATERELLAIFNKLRPWVFSAKDKCLFDSLVLIEFLARYQSFPTWVIGVHTQPFAAHSWVQRAGFVYNGEPTVIRRYTPILAV